MTADSTGKIDEIIDAQMANYCIKQTAESEEGLKLQFSGPAG
jgi:hypothetical protein